VRVTTAFNKLLGIVGATVVAVTFDPDAVTVDLRRRAMRPVCPCGWKGRAVYDRSRRTWRHLDLGANKLFLRAEIRRLHCRRCDRVRTEHVPWARPAARHTRDFEDVVAWLAQRTDKTTITRLLRTSWETVAGIVGRVVAEHLDTRRLDGLVRIGVDEVSWRKGHRYLTVVADHDRDGIVVWASEGKDRAALERFYNELGDVGCAQLQAVSLDLGPAYKAATDRNAPHVRQCADPFHVIKLANDAVDRARREHWQSQRPRRGLIAGRYSRNTRREFDPASRQIKHTRWALLKDPDTLTDNQLATLHTLRRQRSMLYRAWQLKEALRDLYRLARPDQASQHLDWWLAWASRSRIPAFVRLARTIRANRDRILAAVELGLSNSKLEGLNSKIRLINHRGYGHHSAAALIGMIYLCCGGITVQLPTQR
jgi:transposase